MHREAEERHIDWCRLPELQDGITKQADSGCCKHCGFSYNTDYAQAEEGESNA